MVGGAKLNADKRHGNEVGHDGEMSERTDSLLTALTLEEKVSLMTGEGLWHGHGVKRLGIPGLKVSDGPNGARGSGLLGTGIPALCIPCGSALGATWNPMLVEQLGEVLALETHARACHVLLAPTVNIHRTPLGGRNFECYAEDPYLTGRIAVGFIRGVQGGGVGTTIKHFVANDSEFERHSIDVQVPERALREIYLRPFEMAVAEAEPWGIMSAYNQINGEFAGENSRLLSEILRKEWGFTGVVVTDWYAAKSTVAMAHAGLDLEMPGPGIFYGEKLVAAVQSGEVQESVLDEAVQRLLLLLERTNAFENPLDQPEAELEVPAHRALARRAATEAMVLLKNDDVLPLDMTTISSLAVIGPNAATAMLMGGGSAALVPQRAVTPLEALQTRLDGRCRVRHEVGAVTDRSTRPVPRRLLVGSDGSPGFEVKYYNGTNWEGDPYVVAAGKGGRLLTPEDQSGSEEPGVFSFRAVGQLTAELDGPHVVTLIQAGDARVFINGQVVLDGVTETLPRGEAFFGRGSIEIEATVELTAGQPVEMVVEFASDKGSFLQGVQVGLRPPLVDDLMERAVAVAQECDAVVLVVGTNLDWETEGRDREFMELPGAQPELIRRVCAANPNTVVVLNTGSAVTTDWAEDAPAVLQTWFGGQEMSEALVDVLVGDNEPSGRLPNSWPHRLEDTPAFLNYPGEAGVVRYGEGVFVGYRWYQARDVPVAFPFGHGLGYTEFSWGEAALGNTISLADLEAGASLTVTVPVTNVGERPGFEVVQCYVASQDPELARPPQELKAFAKVWLAPGETTEVALVLDHRAFAYYDPGDPTYAERNHRVPVATGGHHRGHRGQHGWFVDLGVHEIRLAVSSAVVRQTLTVDFAGSEG